MHFLKILTQLLICLSIQGIISQPNIKFEIKKNKM